MVKVLDLGLGVLMDGDSQATFATADGVAVGTVDYMSPEQACGRDVDGRSDLFSLGCSLYHLITGRQAFPGTTPIERLGRRINNKHVPITDHPAGPTRQFGGNVLDKLLANKPQDRYQNANEAAEALQALVRPKKPPGTPAASAAVAPAKKAAAEPPVEPKISEPAPPPPPPVIVTVQPTYPNWFKATCQDGRAQAKGGPLGDDRRSCGFARNWLRSWLAFDLSLKNEPIEHQNE